jgi:hypothetical protein
VEKQEPRRKIGGGRGKYAVEKIRKMEIEGIGLTL